LPTITRFCFIPSSVQRDLNPKNADEGLILLTELAARAIAAAWVYELLVIAAVEVAIDKTTARSND
jgi:hypothetical protein